MDIQEIQKITSKDLYHNDILVITVDTGKMPPQRARQYLDRVKAQIEEVIGTEYRVLVKPQSMHIDIINTHMEIRAENTQTYLAGMHTDKEVRDVFGLVQEVSDGVEPVSEVAINSLHDDVFERAKPIG